MIRVRSTSQRPVGCGLLAEAIQLLLTELRRLPSGCQWIPSCSGKLGGRWYCPYVLCPDYRCSGCLVQVGLSPLHQEWLGGWTSKQLGVVRHGLQLPLGGTQGPPSHSTGAGFACCPPCPGPGDWGQLSPPQCVALPRVAIDTKLAIPSHTWQLFTFLVDRTRPHLTRHSRFTHSWTKYVWIILSSPKAWLHDGSIGNHYVLVKENSVKDWPSGEDPLAARRFGRWFPPGSWLSSFSQRITCPESPTNRHPAVQLGHWLQLAFGLHFWYRRVWRFKFNSRF